MKTNVLYYGDNLEILRNREYFPDECIDLIYLDPPFNSKKDYNILFKENGGVESEAQIQAFTDSWHWTQTAQDTYQDIVINGPTKVGGLIGALHEALGNNDVMAYLVMMTARLIELHRVLKTHRLSIPALRPRSQPLFEIGFRPDIRAWRILEMRLSGNVALRIVILGKALNTWAGYMILFSFIQRVKNSPVIWNFYLMMKNIQTTFTAM